MEYYAEHFCSCGCEEQIPIKYWHKYSGIPKYLPGHKRGDHPSSEAREKMRNAKLGTKQSAETCEKKRLAGKNRSPEAIKKTSDANRGRPRSSGTKERIRQSQKRNWKNPEFVRRVIRERNVEQSQPEKKLQEILDQYFPNQFRFVGNFKFLIPTREGTKCPDFVHFTEPFLIELFGDYFHSKKVTGLSEDQHVRERIELFSDLGFKTLVIWEHELQDVHQVVAKIERFLWM